MIASALVALRRASAAILSAAKAAGLAVELHSCRGAVVSGAPLHVVTSLRRSPGVCRRGRFWPAWNCKGHRRRRV
eukprot:11506978-Alexandrium_andersonii.AAC.1